MALERARAWLEDRLAHEHEDLSRVQRLLITQWRLYVYVAHEITHGDYLQRASSLAFASLATLVPVITLSLAMYSAFGGLSKGEVRAWATGVIQQYLLGSGDTKLAGTGPHDTDARLAATSEFARGVSGKGGRVVSTRVAAGAPSTQSTADEGIPLAAPNPPAAPAAPAEESSGSADERAAALDDWSQKVAETVIGISQRASSGSITAAGAGLFILTTILLFNTIEGAFNAIWHVRQRRTFKVKFMSYCTILLIGPLLIGASVYLTARLQPVREWLTQIPTLGGHLFSLSLFLPPFFVTLAAFYVAYFVIPNTRVRWRNALAGAGIAAVLWELAKVGFGVYVAHMVTYQRIYGSLVAIPIFLLWIYLTWVIVLFGAGVAYTSQNLGLLVLQRREAQRRAAVNPYLGLILMYLLAQRFMAGRGAVTLNSLAAATDNTEDRVEAALAPLLDAGLVAAVAGAERAFQPARPVETMSIAAVLEAVRRTNTYDLPARRLDATMKRVLERVAACEAKGLKDVTFGGIISGEAGEDDGVPKPVVAPDSAAGANKAHIKT